MSPDKLRRAMRELCEFLTHETGEATIEEHIWSMGIQVFLIDDDTLTASDPGHPPLVWVGSSDNGNGWCEPKQLIRKDFR